MHVAGRVVEYATDAALLPGGRHVLVRGPGSASVYTFPRFQRLGSFRLPRQRQGEGVSVGPGSRIRLSSEGVHSTVRQVSLPAVVRLRMQPPTSPTSSPSATVSTSASATPLPGDEPGERDGGTQGRWLIWSIPVVLVLGGVGIALGLRRRPDQAS